MPDPSPYPAPTSAADPRPGGKPYYIDPLCPTCGAPLVLMDVLEPPSAPGALVWHDEWACPMCRDGTVHMDWPPEE